MFSVKIYQFINYNKANYRLKPTMTRQKLKNIKEIDYFKILVTKIKKVQCDKQTFYVYKN